MKKPVITRTTPLTDKELEALKLQHEQSLKAADELSARLRVVDEGIKKAKREQELVDATNLKLDQLLAIERWLQYRKSLE